MKWALLFFITAVSLLGSALVFDKGAQGAVNVSALVPEIATSTVLNAATGENVSVTNADNTTSTFAFPGSFYGQNLVLDVYSYTMGSFSSTKPAPSGKNFVGKSYDFNLSTIPGNGIHAISLPATITLTYNDSDFTGLDESTILPYHWGVNDTAWQLISGSILDTANNTVTFSTANFSSFSLFASAPTPPAPPVTPPSGGGGGGGGMSVIPLPEKPTKPPAPGTTGDFNNDGKYDVADLSILLFYYGKTGPSIAKYDLNGDGKVGFTDISILFYFWNQ